MLLTILFFYPIPIILFLCKFPPNGSKLVSGRQVKRRLLAHGVGPWTRLMSRYPSDPNPMGLGPSMLRKSCLPPPLGFGNFFGLVLCWAHRCLTFNWALVFILVLLSEFRGIDAYENSFNGWITLHSSFFTKILLWYHLNSVTTTCIERCFEGCTTLHNSFFTKILVWHPLNLMTTTCISLHLTAIMFTYVIYLLIEPKYVLV